eukprot:CAMPEP_0185021736 /NCGR_PEP_ID=MMETSP1103-20130426/4436_1 /TAXON_ID=36769 /ORGANISM="Paraphysomonas bandaiensis, Strain Caron Lab Isolate" /LENGTH=157 /DNA_ID=CAMNT_0027553441 /DNA_START=38 /DNA_END=511 /DNA_ORIENTATION=-
MIRTALNIGRRNFATAAAAGAPELRLTFGTPHNPIYTDKVVSGISLPGEDGYYGVLANKTPVIGQLKAGTVTIYHVGGEQEKFFVSGGFAFSREDSTTDVACPEAFPIDDFDVDAMKKEFAAASKAFASTNVPEEKAEAFIQLTALQELSRGMGVTL